MLKNALLIGLLLAVIGGVAITIVVLQTQTHTQSNAAQATSFSFGGPTSANVGDNIDKPIIVNPQSGSASNQVSFVKVAFTYDGTKLAKTGAGLEYATKYTALEGPSVNCDATNTCTASVTLSVGNSPSNVISSQTTVATMHFTALAATNGTPTPLTFVSGQNQALSVASTDQPAENVFSTGTNAAISINGTGGGASGTPAPTGPIPTGPTPTGSIGGESSPVSCDSLSVDVASGEAPLTVVFSATGSSTTTPITKFTFNFGDGLVQDASTSADTTNVSTQTTHIYHDNGTYTASATVTNQDNATSDPSQCTTTIQVGNVALATATPTPNPSIASTGPGQTLVSIGITGVAITVLGIALIAIF